MDQHYKLGQENLFQYLFGINEQDCIGIIEVETRKTYLFVKLPTDQQAVWEKFKTLDDYKRLYEIDEALKIEELTNYLDKIQSY